VPGDCIDGWPRDPSRLDRTRDGVRVTSESPSLSLDCFRDTRLRTLHTTMSREQLNVGDLLPLLETSDLRQLDEIKGLINEHLNT
ncbi:hypothetical protein M9458_042337, partial [Cirrhinus mrigala]